MPPAIRVATPVPHSSDLTSILMALFIVCVRFFLITLQTTVFTIETAVWLICAPIRDLIVLTANLLDSLDAVASNHRVSGPVATTDEPTAAIHSPPVVSHSRSPNTAETVPDSPRPIPYICPPEIVSSRFYAVLVGRRIGVFEDWWASFNPSIHIVCANDGLSPHATEQVIFVSGGLMKRHSRRADALRHFLAVHNQGGTRVISS
jgi:hypothetical protein